jgi:dihydrofolate synthase/folylpolyglutamate synthase
VTRNLPALLEALQRRARFGMVLGLDGIRRALGDLGDPQRAFPSVHVGGSNGKGSVCAMVEAVARAAGLRTGLYTSPHLSRFAERIRINGEPIEDEAFARALDQALGARGGELTFFEALTAAAFLAFRDAQVDIAVIEVGLGGRLDATNVIEAPAATAITSIALEHTEVLGSTIPLIAHEKAGILKTGAPVATGPLDGDAMREVAAIAGAVGAGPIWRVGRSGQSEEDDQQYGSIGGPPARFVRVSQLAGGQTLIEAPAEHGGSVAARLGLRGAHQAENAGVAASIAWQIAGRFPRINEGLLAGLEAARWPGRFERIERAGIHVILDCAHNPHGALALAKTLVEEGLDRDRTALVFGALADKAWEPMLRALSPLAAARYYATPKGRAAAGLDELAAVANGAAAGDPRAAIDAALAGASPGDTIVVTGSLYLVGEVRAALLGIESDPVIAL